MNKDFRQAIADLIDEADEAHTDFVFIPDLIKALGIEIPDEGERGEWYANAAKALRGAPFVRVMWSQP